MQPCTYVLPFRSTSAPSAEFVAYVNWLSIWGEVIVVDGSHCGLFQTTDQQLHRVVRHIRPDEDFMTLQNGKVRGVLTGLRAATHEFVVVADDDVRYTEDSLRAMLAALAHADVVRPQNYFEPLPWHARLDTARSLINRMTGGDWPGTLGVRRSTLVLAGGYDGDVLFENLELVRTIVAAGGAEAVRLDLFVRRLPPHTRHYWSQRIRQAYDEFARPARLGLALAGLPLLLWMVASRQWLPTLCLFVFVPIAVAEVGRLRQGGGRVFPLTASLAAPLWILERAVCAWLAVGVRVVMGGMPYYGNIVTVAAHSSPTLARRQHTRLSNRQRHHGVVVPLSNRSIGR